MAIKSICKADVASVERNSTLKEVSQLMAERHVGSVVVTDTTNGKTIPAGIITDRDIALAVGNSSDPQSARVDEIMQSQPITATVSEGIYEVAEKMRQHGVKRLPIVNEDGSLYGIVSSDDLLMLMSEEIDHLANIGETQVQNEQGLRVPTSPAPAH